MVACLINHANEYNNVGIDNSPLRSCSFRFEDPVDRPT